MSSTDAKPSKLHRLIFIGMGAGFVVGLALLLLRDGQPGLYGAALWWLDLLGPTLFIGALKMIIAPLIFASIVAGVTSLPNLKELGSIGYRTVLYYLATTTLAVCIGLALVLTIQPGHKQSSEAIRQARQTELAERRVEYGEQTGSAALGADGTPTPTYVAWLARREGASRGQGQDQRWTQLQSAKQQTPADLFRDNIVRPILENPFQALSSNPPNALGIIFFSLLLGIALSAVGKSAEPVVQWFRGLNEGIMRITHWLMALSPVAIGCIIAGLVAENGPGIFQSLGWYVVTVIVGIAVHIAALFVIARVVGKVEPRRLWRGVREAWLIAFSTRSSAATLPVTLSCVTEKLRVRPKVANFSLPLGATMNMDGTALYEGVAVLFLIQIYGGLDDVTIATGAMTTVLVFVTAVLASVGAAAVPNAGLVTMVLVASAVHLPIYYIPLIFAVDAFLDMFRTSTNVLGDAVGAIAVDRMIGDGSLEAGGDPAAAESPHRADPGP
ncbi:MAG: dicarboxylate/amino acid:cation symporter [Deltaproteobacteria bacterium]|jgi:Na+/H+-dicarboxylate symporter|nr:dicarboxylate/amino acid:cation symporter [Deltaproteobacteria bacterium]MBW2532265.1 dicarboxylate/amino acid:cation symporter [Deltaproteobacteria bacterium]